MSPRRADIRLAWRRSIACAGLDVALVEAVPVVRRIVLFGSRAAGDEEERSDIDLAISAPGLDDLSFSMLRDAVAEAPTLYTISLARLDDKSRYGAAG